MLQQRVIRFLLDQSKKEPEKYNKFFEDYGLFMREGIVTTQEQDVKVAQELCIRDKSPGFQRLTPLTLSLSFSLPLRRTSPSCCASSPRRCPPASTPT